MKGLRFAIYILLIMCIGACQKNDEPTNAPKLLMLDALDKLAAHDYDGYMELVDIDCEMDSAHRAFMKQVLSQYQQRQEVRKGYVQNKHVVNAKLLSDTVCVVYYKLTFPKNVEEVNTQKMVKVGDDWKLRLRN